MSLIALDSLDDPRLAPYRDLKASNLTRWSGLFVAEGEKLVRRLIASRFSIDSLLLGQSEIAAFMSGLPEEVPIYVVPDNWVERIIGFNFHRGVLACGRRPGERPQLDGIIRAVSDSYTRSTIVLCPEIHDPDNLGALIRTGCALGVDALVLGPHAADPLARRVLRVSMGTALELPIVQSPDFAEDLARLKQAGYELAAAVLDEGAEPLTAASRADRFTLMIGSEGHGLASRWIDACDRRITIPMRRGTDSLNLAVAAGIFLHHFQNR